MLSEHGCLVGYNGYIHDPATGDYCVRHRWYVPPLGRWAKRDPAGYTDGVVLYQYAGGTPGSLVDPSGLSGYRIGGLPPFDASDQLQAQSDAAHNTGTALSWVTIKAIEARANATAYGGQARGFSNAAAHLWHFLGGSGEEYEIRFKEMNYESASAHAHMIREINDAMAAAEHLGRDNEDVFIVATTEVTADNASGDWLYAVGGYRTWARARVMKCGDQYVMGWEFHFRDFYDWDPNNAMGGGLVTDREMAMLHRSKSSKAREYRMSGQQTIEVSWTEGERFEEAEVRGMDRPIRGSDRDRRRDRRRRER